MIFKSFIPSNLIYLCMKIINSVVLVGLYYGFMTTFSIGPSYLFLIRTRVLEEGTEKKVSATTGFIVGQLMMFISIYYAPLHLALGRPHTLTVLALPYLLFHFFWNNQKGFFYYGSTTRNSMRNLSIQCVFLNNFIFQLFNHFILPSSMLARLVNIYMFRCNNKMLFVTSSFVGWLIGHILVMKWVGLVLVWTQKNHFFRSKGLIRSNKYLVSKFNNFISRIFSILLFITCVYYLGRIPSPILILTKKLKGTAETEEREKSEEERNIETISEGGKDKQKQRVSIEEDPSFSPFSEERENPNKIDQREEIRVNGKKKKKTKGELYFRFKETYSKNSPVYEASDLDGNQENSKFELVKKKEDKYLLWFEKPLVTLLFDYKRWNRPFRYIKNDRFDNAIKKEMSQYFFYTCQSDGKEKISFTYPPSLATFVEMIQKKISFFTPEKWFSDELDTDWSFINELKRINLSKEFLNRVESLDKESFYLGILEKRTRFSNININNETKKEYLPKLYDPFLQGPYRGRIKKEFSPSSINQTYKKKNAEPFWINKIHAILLTTDYQEFEQTIDTLNIKLLSREQDLSLLTEDEGVNIDSEDRVKILKFLFNIVITNPNNQIIRKKPIGIKEIKKRVPRWSYKLINDLQQRDVERAKKLTAERGIRSRKFKRVVIFTNKQSNTDTNTKDANDTDQTDKEVALIRYSQQSDFRRNIIKGSMRAQRRKTVTWELFQANVHSPLFLDSIDKPPFFYFDVSGLLKRISRSKNKESQISNSNYTEKKKIETKDEQKREQYKREEKMRIEIAEAWDSISLAQVIRGSALITQSILRKYIILPSLIIAKNIARMLLFQFPEWAEDFKDWKQEMHVKCTYNGVQLSETEFPKNWLTDGIQIKILFPFCLKPWHRLQLHPSHKDPMKKKKGQKNDFCFLTVWGMETELPFGSPRKRRSFFEPIFKELKKKMKKFKTKCFIALRILKERTKLFGKVLKETKKWITKSILFLKGIIKELSKKNRIPFSFLGLGEIYELDETKKDSIISNKMIHESSLQIQSMEWTNYSLTEKKIKDLTKRTNTIKNQIEKILKDKKNEFLTQEQEINISSNKISYQDKILESSKKNWQILKKRNIRLIRKFSFFIKFFIEKIYIDLFLCIINIPRTNTQRFLELTKKIIDKFIYNNEANQERLNKTNKNTIHFISTIKNSLSNIRNKNTKAFCNLSSLSQAYVFYKLSQTQVISFYKFKPILQYHGTSLFLKNEIKDYFEEQGISHSRLRHDYRLRQKSFWHSGMNEWKNWLRGHYPYDLSQSRWLRLVPGQWRNRVNQHSMSQNKDLTKRDSYEKERLIHYEKKNDFQVNSLLNQKYKLNQEQKYKKYNFKKHYGYDFLSYKFINYQDKGDSYTYGSPLQGNKKKEISYNYNMDKRNFFDTLGDIPIHNYLGEDDIMATMSQFSHRKYFDWRILNFCVRNKADIESWINTGTKNNNNIKTVVNNYQIIDKIKKRGPFYFTISQESNPSNKKRSPFDWMGMNEEILRGPISNLELWLFPEFLLLYNAYKVKPWIIPIKLLLLNLNGNGTINQNIIENEKRDPLIASNEKKTLGLEIRNQEQKERISQGDPVSDAQKQANLRSVLSNQEKDGEEDYGKSNKKKRIKKKQSKSNIEAELHFFLKRYLRFQLRWDDCLNQRIINNIKVYCLLLRLINPNKIFISSIQRGEMNLDILMIPKDLTLTEVMKKAILIIEPVRLSVKKDGQFILYQTISISLVHNNKHQINQRYQEKNFIDKKNFDESIVRHQKMTENKETNHYDLFVPENILSPNRRRELRILISFNSRDKKGMHRDAVFLNNVTNCRQVLNKNKHLDSDKKKLIKLKFFLWPNYRLEDLACMNRYWFNTNNGSRFSMVRIHMYPRLKIR